MNMTKLGARAMGLALIWVAVQAVAQQTAPAPAVPSDPAAPTAAATAAASAPPSATAKGDDGLGPVTKLALPRYVSLKTSEGNARRGPGLTHRIDWVFTAAGMPLRVTAEYENWRRVEDADGAGGWIHYTLLSSARTVLITEDMAEFLNRPEAGATVVYQAEYGVIGRILECDPDWCRVSVDGTRGWALKTALWGVDPGEIVE